jgi:hypothetical protein
LGTISSKNNCTRINPVIPNAELLQASKEIFMVGSRRFDFKTAKTTLAQIDQIDFKAALISEKVKVCILSSVP